MDEGTGLSIAFFVSIAIKRWTLLDLPELELVKPAFGGGSTFVVSINGVVHAM
jgi:hypothetical protein